MARSAEFCLQQLFQEEQLEQFLPDHAMDPGILAGKTYFELLQSEADSSLLYKHTEEPAELPTDQSADIISEDQDNNPDVFYTVESDESGEEVCRWSNTGEAYDKIAALAEYLLKDKQEEPVEELFGSLTSDDAVAECLPGCREAKRRGSCSDAPELKHRKLAHSCVVNSSSVAIPLDSSPAATMISQSNFHVEFSVTTISPAGRSPKAFGLPSGVNLGYCLPITEDIQLVFAFEPADLPAGIIARPEPTDAFCRRLKSHFRGTCHVVPMERELPLQHLYVDGELTQCALEGRSGRNAELRLCDLEEKWGAGVPRSKLLRVPGRSELGSKVLVVLGKAGMGKSLLVQKICLDWSEGKWPDYDFVFRFDCRSLCLLRDHRLRSLKHLLLELSDGPGEGGDEVYRYILRNPERVLLAFDGFEELMDRDGFLPCSDSPPCRESSGLGDILDSLLQKKILRGCTVLLTTRPKDKLHQYLPRVDMVLGVTGFSMQQVELYLARYFEGSPGGDEAVHLIRGSPYLLSHCYNPNLCQFVCESVFETGAKELPPTLTGLFVKFLLRKLACSTKEEAAALHRNVAALARAAWSLTQSHRKAFTSDHFPSPEVKDFALGYGLVLPSAFPQNTSSGKAECGYAFSSFIAQNFLVALHLVLAKEIKDKGLTQHLHLLSKSKKFLSSWNLVPRFLSGLLFLKDDLGVSLLFGEETELDAEKMISKKQKTLLRYVRRLAIRSFGPDKLLELLHCIHETENPSLLQHLALALKPDLSFLGFPLTPSDVYVLHSALKRSTKKFTLDLRESSVDPEGLGRLVVLKNVATFRASLGDAVRLWKRLWETEAGEPLQSAIGKFVVAPFKAKTIKDVEDLSALVRLQEKVSQGQADPSGCNIHLIPAIADLRQLEFSLGPICGSKGFRALVKILDAFPALQHLDLDSPKENEIKDEGVVSLSEVLPRLTSLETLNLSRNKITDLGAAELARALLALPSLKTLSLYNNNIGDPGAESFAKILPQMTSLRVLDIHCNKITAAGAQHLTDSLRKCPHIQSVALWNPTIPHYSLGYLQQLDSRIRLL